MADQAGEPAGERMISCFPAPARIRLLRFAGVGIGAALLFFVLTWLFVSLGAPPFLGSVVAYAVAFAFAYLAQRGWTFGAAHSHGHALPRYLLAQFGCATVSGLVGQLCVGLFAASPFWMSMAATMTAGAISYLLSSRWVFAGHSLTN